MLGPRSRSRIKPSTATFSGGRPIRRPSSLARRIGRPSIQLDPKALRRDWQRGCSLNELAKTYHIGKSTTIPLLREAQEAGRKSVVVDRETRKSYVSSVKSCHC